jgi:putative iron-dependent peroxidase
MGRMSAADKTKAQPSILAECPPVGRSITFRLMPDLDFRSALGRLRDGLPIDAGVVGLGEPVVRALGRNVPGLVTFPALSGAEIAVPSTQQALWVFLRGADRGVLFDATMKLRILLYPAIEVQDLMDTFVYAGGRDLTGYEDGTENPKGDAAADAAFASGAAGFAGSSFVAVQRWAHDLKHFSEFPGPQRDDIIGRHRDTNEEMKDAPVSSHVKRTAQESYDPPAFMLRRSMPWAGTNEQGLEFIAYVESINRFDRMMRRMVGLEDGIADALFKFSRAVTGGYYWCPPIQGGRLDLSLLGL